MRPNRSRSSRRYPRPNTPATGAPSGTRPPRLCGRLRPVTTPTDEPAYRGRRPRAPHREPEYQEAEYERRLRRLDTTTSTRRITPSRTTRVPSICSRYREPEDAEPGLPRPRRNSVVRRRSPPPRPPSRAQHTGEWEGGEWTGSHRAIQTGRRGVSLGVIGALVAVVVVVAAFILWRFFGDALSNRSSIASARCVDGQKRRRRHRRSVHRRPDLDAGQEVQRDRQPGRRQVRR